MGKRIVRLGFELEGDYGYSDVEFAQMMGETLPKEWWQADDEWYMTAIYALEEDGSLSPQDARLKKGRRASLGYRVIEILNHAVRDGAIGTDAADRLESAIWRAIKQAPGLHQIEQTERAREVETMVAQIVNVLEKAGYSMGWGDDEQLTELERATNSISDAVIDLNRKLDEIRTNAMNLDHARMEVTIMVEVEFDPPDTGEWKDWELAAVEAAHDQGLIPEGWMRVGHPHPINKRPEPKHKPRTVECACGCGATRLDDGRCECGQAIGHR